MNEWKNYRRRTMALFLALAVAFVFTAFNATKSIVAEQSRQQQQALSPVYKLVRDELLRPLYIAETFASSVNSVTRIDTPDVEEDVLLDHLQEMEQKLDLVFFVASEKARRQFFSNGRVLDLVEGQVAWYFQAMAEDKDFIADLGQVGDVHLFFDVKIYSRQREFLGYVGVGKRIQRFLETFDSYKAQYGYDFLFVNDRNEVILTSFPELVVTDAYIPSLESLEWFSDKDLSDRSLDSEIIQVNEQDYLISEFGIEELDWQLLLLVPLDDRQSQITRSFIGNTVVAFVIVLLLGSTALYLMLLYKGHLEDQTEIDSLSGLPNRDQIQRRFGELRRSGMQLCVILVDLDHFKRINDTRGHHTGDEVIRAVANTLKEGLREMDIVGRWGGEEFVMLIPAASIDLGASIAERARMRVASLAIKAEGHPVPVTASFGVAFGTPQLESLVQLLARADAALYEAKHGGRNQVQLEL